MNRNVAFADLGFEDTKLEWLKSTDGAILESFYHPALRVTEPLFILHGDADTIIPMRYGQKLFALANEPKQMKVIAGGDHHLIPKKPAEQAYIDFFYRVFLKNQAAQ
jgi:fermentation-respiration switch protein FrsA (DUF1100 family)